MSGGLKDKQAFEAPRQVQDELKVKPIEGIPDIHEVMRSSGLECVREAQERAAKGAEQKTKGEAAAQREASRRIICCCRSAGCRIGPMIYEDG